MSVCNCQECERRRERGDAEAGLSEAPAPERGRAELRRDGVVIASGTPWFISAIARNL